MKIDEIKSVILLAGEYRVLTNEWQALNPGGVVEIGVKYPKTRLQISFNITGIKFRISGMFIACPFGIRLWLLGDNASVKRIYEIQLPRSETLTTHYYVTSLDIITLIIAEFLLDDLTQHSS